MDWQTKATPADLAGVRRVPAIAFTVHLADDPAAGQMAWQLATDTGTVQSDWADEAEQILAVARAVKAASRTARPTVVILHGTYRIAQVTASVLTNLGLTAIVKSDSLTPWWAPVRDNRVIGSPNSVPDRKVATDGSCSLGLRNRFVGYAWVADDGTVRSQGYRSGSRRHGATEAEIVAIASAVKRTPRGSTVEIHTDSSDAIEEILRARPGQAAQTERGRLAVMARDRIAERDLAVRFIQVKGHARWEPNELADKLAISARLTAERRARRGPTLAQARSLASALTWTLGPDAQWTPT